MARSGMLAARVGVALALATLLMSCAGGDGAPSSPMVSSEAGPSTPASTPSTPATAAVPAPSASAEATITAAPALPLAPPAAWLDGLAHGGPVAGSLGTYTWGTGGTDAPWIVAGRAGSARAGATLDIAFGGLAPVSWTAAWATVQSGTASSPVGASSGTAAVAVAAPSRGGDWSLRVTANFGPGASATYYWRLTVSP